MTDDLNGKPRFHRSFFVQTIIDRIQKMAVGDTVPLAELAALVSGNPKSNLFRSQLASARRAVQRDGRKVFGVAGGAITRLDDPAIVSTASDTLQRIRRASVRGVARLGCVDYAALSQADRARHDAAASHLGILAECSRPKVVAKIADKALEKQQKLTLDETLAAFRGQ